MNSSQIVFTAPTRNNGGVHSRISRAIRTVSWILLAPGFFAIAAGCRLLTIDHFGMGLPFGVGCGMLMFTLLGFALGRNISVRWLFAATSFCNFGMAAMLATAGYRYISNYLYYSACQSCSDSSKLATLYLISTIAVILVSAGELFVSAISLVGFCRANEIVDEHQQIEMGKIYPGKLQSGTIRFNVQYNQYEMLAILD